MSEPVIADTILSWLPAWTGLGFGLLACLCLAIWAFMRLAWGKPVAPVNMGIGLVRLLAILAAVLILLGPTIVDIQPGQQRRPDLYYLFDGSSSMQLGDDVSRWDECLQFVSSAHSTVDLSASGDVEGYRFGHSLSALEHTAQGRDDDDASAQAYSQLDLSAAEKPTESDSRLADAMRQILPRIDAKNSAGVVLLSDGRVRATESVESLAEHFEQLGLPIHVVPVGKSEGTGDIAIVSLVVESTVRKHTENELQVFFRSFGYTGRRTVVRLVKPSTDASQPDVTIASLPVTLSGGAQSASLKFRVEADPVDLRVTIDPIEGELAETNNRIATHIDIDRTKLRVLYIEGDAMPLTANSIQFAGVLAPSGDRGLADLLKMDEDIECIMLVSQGGTSQPIRVAAGTSTSSTTTFPKSRAELFAFDCIIFSNCAPDIIDDAQLDDLAQWVNGRGGGLVLSGAAALRPEAWTDTPLSPLMPLNLETVRLGNTESLPVVVSEPKSAIWQMSLESTANSNLLSTIPALSTPLESAAAKQLTTVLARYETNGLPMMAVQRVGRGRVLLSTAAIAGKPLRSISSQWGTTPGAAAGKLWRNMVYWSTEGSSVGRRRLVGESNKRFYRPGERLEVAASAFDEGARKTQQYRVYAMLEPASLDDMSIYSPVLWPENIVRDSGEVGPRIAWGEELLLPKRPDTNDYRIDLNLGENSMSGDSSLRIEMTAYEGAESETAYGHGTQVDSTSLAIQILSDPFEQQNPLPNHEFMSRIAAITGGQVLSNPRQLADILRLRQIVEEEPDLAHTPAWSRWWVWLLLIGLISAEWIWRRSIGLA